MGDRSAIFTRALEAPHTPPAGTLPPLEVRITAALGTSSSNLGEVVADRVEPFTRAPDARRAEAVAVWSVIAEVQYLEVV